MGVPSLCEPLGPACSTRGKGEPGAGHSAPPVPAGLVKAWFVVSSR